MAIRTEIALMWKTHLIIILIMSTTARAAMKPYDVSLETFVDGGASVAGVSGAESVA